MKDSSSENGVTLDPSSLSNLKQIASNSDLYLITRCDENDQTTYPLIHSLLESHGLFKSGFNPVVCICPRWSHDDDDDDGDSDDDHDHDDFSSPSSFCALSFF